MFLSDMRKDITAWKKQSAFLFPAVSAISVICYYIISVSVI